MGECCEWGVDVKLSLLSRISSEIWRDIGLGFRGKRDNKSSYSQGLGEIAGDDAVLSTLRKIKIKLMTNYKF